MQDNTTVSVEERNAQICERKSVIAVNSACQYFIENNLSVNLDKTNY